MHPVCLPVCATSKGILAALLWVEIKQPTIDMEINSDRLSDAALQDDFQWLYMYRIGAVLTSNSRNMQLQSARGMCSLELLLSNVLVYKSASHSHGARATVDGGVAYTLSTKMEPRNSHFL